MEEYLHNTAKSYIAVSHDRAFLTAVTSKVWEINLGRLDQYACGFDGYLRERAERRRLHAHRYKHQQEEIKRLEEFVRRHMAGQKTKQAQSKLKYLGRIKRLPPPQTDGRGPSIRVNTSGRSYAHVMALENVSVGYGPTTVVAGIGLDLYRGDKIGIIGRNGSGKTTLLRSLIGELAPIEGDIKLGNNVEVAYFDQELSDLKPDLTVIDNLWELDPGAEIGRIRSFLGRFGFTGDDGFKVVRSLSGGEKTKLSLARLLYHPANFIIFDEPTNHLDIDSREALEQALNDYDGSCLVVSHDRYFLDRVVNKIAHIADGHIKVYDGNYAEFREQTTETVDTAKPKESKSKDTYRAFKEESRRRSRYKKELQSLKARIVNQEREAARLEREINQGIPRSDWEMLHDASERKKQVEETLLELYARLEELEDADFD
ncbi:MAG: ABC-F family ATP-binding cassette domain-containing protein [candidate division Zixibacteria bacterium]|nr:ABC-F family ATP-binding cassette domain-containing protein [candidate division Zixibacteria bacterium]